MALVDTATAKIPVGISSCLLGEEVRYNGGHKHSAFCTQVLANYMVFEAFCPEVAIGMGIPREPIRLVGDLVAPPRAVGVKNPELDVSQPLRDYADSVARACGNLRGYIFMKDSPSCGLYSTKVYSAKGAPLGKRAGLFAERLRERLPLLPVEEAGRLSDAPLRENFVARVFAYDAWCKQVAAEPTAHKLVAFHSRYKYFVMSYSQALYRDLGRMVARAGVEPINELAGHYIARFMAGTQKPPSHRGHVNVLFHMVGYLRDELPAEIRQDLIQSIEEYRARQVPLAVPMKLMRHYLQRYACDYIKQQSYLDPHPFELGLRNAI